MDRPVLYRKRLIPYECVPLTDDHLVHFDDTVIITSWRAFRPKPYLSYGDSCYYLKEGYKVSRFYRADHSFYCWYCDIVDYQYEEGSSAVTVVDLLADVVVFPDGKLKVVDLDELADAFECGLIDASLLKKSLRSLNRLLQEIYANGTEQLRRPLEQYIPHPVQ